MAFSTLILTSSMHCNCRPMDVNYIKAVQVRLLSSKVCAGMSINRMKLVRAALDEHKHVEMNQGR